MISVSAALTGFPGPDGDSSSGRTLANAVESFHCDEIQTVALQSCQDHGCFVFHSPLFLARLLLIHVFPVADLVTGNKERLDTSAPNHPSTIVVSKHAHQGANRQLTGTSYPFGLPGPGFGGFQVTLISDEEMLKALTSEGASFGSEEKRNGDSLNAPQKCFLLCRFNPDMRGDQLTPLGGVDDDDFAERPVSLVVVHPNLHFKSS